MGWTDDGERPGLGAAGREGAVMPVKTALKRDTAGLGARSYEKRVTHFETRSEDAARGPSSRRRDEPPVDDDAAVAMNKARHRLDEEEKAARVRALRRDLDGTSDVVPEALLPLLEEGARPSAVEPRDQGPAEARPHAKRRRKRRRVS
mmetsp:Transcript_7845/g.32425  ORF Transcript_7845/g.32425 Transcript_7845/m.32425 type:complete len:148 (+) Transcript_7845:559-1002(+)